jgi:hypothetical protein
MSTITLFQQHIQPAGFSISSLNTRSLTQHPCMLRGALFKNIANFKKAHPLRRLLGNQMAIGNRDSN